MYWANKSCMFWQAHNLYNRYICMCLTTNILSDDVKPLIWQSWRGKCLGNVWAIYEVNAIMYVAICACMLGTCFTCRTYHCILFVKLVRRYRSRSPIPALKSHHLPCSGAKCHAPPVVASDPVHSSNSVQGQKERVDHCEHVFFFIMTLHYYLKELIALPLPTAFLFSIYP